MAHIERKSSKEIMEIITEALESLSDSDLRAVADKLQNKEKTNKRNQLFERGWIENKCGQWHSPTGEVFSFETAYEYCFQYGGCIEAQMESKWEAREGPYGGTLIHGDRLAAVKKELGDRCWYVCGPVNDLVCDQVKEHQAKRIASDHNERLATRTAKATPFRGMNDG